MKHRKQNPRRRRNPDPLIVVAWAAGSAAAGAVVSYLVFREIAATKITQACVMALGKQGVALPTQREASEIRRQAFAQL